MAISSVLRLATIALMTGLGRAGGLPPSLLKLVSCLNAYSACWPASTGLVGIELLPSGIRRLGAGEPVEVVTLDGVDKSPRLAGGGDQVIPPPRRHVRPPDKAGEPGRNRVGPVKIVEEPAVQAVRTQRTLDGRYIKGHRVFFSIGLHGRQRPLFRVLTLGCGRKSAAL